MSKTYQTIQNLKESYTEDAKYLSHDYKAKWFTSVQRTGHQENSKIYTALQDTLETWQLT